MIDATHRLVHYIARIFPLSEAERHALATLPVIERTFEPHQDIAREGDRPSHCCLITEGWACRYQTIREGGRQILALHIPGDTPDLQSLHLKIADHNLAAITPVTAHFISHDQIFKLIDTYPRLGAAFWKLTLIDAAIYRKWILNMGRQDALPRMAHLFCELFMRLQAIDQVKQSTCAFPLTQLDLADALGITTVHVNRVLRDLRNHELIVLDHRTLTILEWSRLKATAEFDPTYLHQDLISPA